MSKKGKKSKGKTLNLTEFLGSGTSSNSGQDGEFQSVVVAKSSWADEMDDYEEYPSSSRKEQFVLPTAPRAARGPDFSDDRIPRDPPYTAYVANLSYEVEEEHIKEFFSKLKIKSVRLPRDGDAETGRLKGFGYADFEDRDSLVEALGMSEQTLLNRKVRVDLATHAGKGMSGESGMGRMGGGRSRYGDRDDGEEDRTTGDWRSGPRSDAPPPPSRGGDFDRRGGFDRYEAPRDRYGERGGDDRRGDNNRGYGFGGEDNFDRSQMRSSTAPREEGSRYGDHRDGGGRSSRPSGYGGGGGYIDRYGGGGGGRRSPAEERGDVPKERPKLNLAKRSATKDNEAGNSSASNNAAAGGPSSIFGGAKPVDTARKEKEIEDKLKTTSVVDPQPLKIEGGGNRKQPPPPPLQGSGAAGAAAASGTKNIFGAAKPVDTTAREREIEERLRKEREDNKRENADSEKGQKDEQEGEKRRGGGGNQRVIDLGRHPRSDARGDNWDHHRSSRGNGGDGGPPGTAAASRAGEGGGARFDSVDTRRKRESRSPPPTPPAAVAMKKIPEEKKAPPNFVASNKFAFLQDEEDATSEAAGGGSSESGGGQDSD